MKTVILLSLLLITVTKSFAQHDPDKLFYLTKVEKYRRMKNTGIVLTSAGTVLTVVGLVSLVNYTGTTSSYGSTSYDNNLVAGLAAYLLGLSSLGAGIPLWIVGAHSERKYTKKLEDVSLRLKVTPQSGLTLAYRF